MTYNPRDHYFKKAKKEGFRARSVYKLDEIQDKFKVLKSGDRVLDLGAAPGSWSQFTQKLIGPKGFLIGVDLQSINLNFPNAEFLVKDVRELTDEDVGNELFDVVLSDMAPRTTGIAIRDKAESEELCRLVISVVRDRLKVRGHMVMKFFMSSGYKDLESEMKKLFSEVKAFRPKGTRTQSSEIFLIGRNRLVAK